MPATPFDQPSLLRPALGAGSPHYHWWITAALMLGFTTVGLSVTVVNIAFPKIMTSLRVDLDVMQWVQTGYMIMQAVIMPSVGWVGARLGNRRVYLLALGIFVGGSALSGLAWDVSSLIVFRLVQAVGGGLLFPTSQVILFETFPENKRGLAMGVSSLGFSLGPMMGPVLGGYLIEYASWRAVFYINVPVGILGLILAYLILPTAPRQSNRPLDLPGMLTLAAFLVSLLLAVSQGNDEGWDSQYILTLFGIALIAGAGFVVAELRHDQPFVELRLYKSLAFSLASIVVFINTISFMAANFIVILFLQIHLDYTPLQAAWMMMPSAVVIGVLSVGAGRLSDLLPGKILIIFGLGAVAICLVQYASITAWTSVGTITLWLTARGFARAFTIAPLSAVSFVGPGRIPGAHGFRPAEPEPRHRQHRQRGAGGHGVSEPRGGTHHPAGAGPHAGAARRRQAAGFPDDHLPAPRRPEPDGADEINGRAARARRRRGGVAQLPRHLSAHRRHHRPRHCPRPVDGQVERFPEILT